MSEAPLLLILMAVYFIYLLMGIYLSRIAASLKRIEALLAQSIPSKGPDHAG